tara:strand:+ start:137 stop:1696 length:1560 start_codon:yes stop_codon:yes gene_type:complete
MLSQLEGIFAFAIWDKKTEELILARDGLGVKPLYYCQLENAFLFSSEIKSLISLMVVPKNINHNAVEKYMTYLWCPGSETPLASVKKLEPGHFLKVKGGKVLENVSWYELPINHVKRKKKLTKTNLFSQASKLLRAAVHRQMISDVPVGAFLSGGLDSSSIVCFAKEVNPSLSCFTIETLGGTEEGTPDDLPYAKQVATHFNLPLEIIPIDSLSLSSQLEKMIWSLDEPLADPAALNVLFISELAKKNGIKVLLSGLGGDDLFSGYRRHKAIAYEDWFKWVPLAIREFLSAKSKKLNQGKSLNRRLSKFISSIAQDGDWGLIKYFQWIDKSDLEELFSDQFLKKKGNGFTEEPMLQFLKILPKNLTKLSKALELEKRFFLPDHNLIYTDKMSMSTGVEVRVPFLDSELIEFAASIPDRLRISWFQEKYILKKAMEPYLPNEIIYRPKTGFGSPVRRWIKHDLKDYVREMLNERAIKGRDLFNPKKITELIEANESGKIDASYTIFSLLCLEIWFRKFID